MTKPVEAWVVLSPYEDDELKVFWQEAVEVWVVFDPDGEAASIALTEDGCWLDFYSCAYQDLGEVEADLRSQGYTCRKCQLTEVEDE